MSGRIRKRKGAKNEQSIENVLQDYLAARAAIEEESLQNDAGDEEDEIENPDDGMDAVETYAVYWPAKLNIGAKHPDPVVCTASLASVESADITYCLKLPEKIIKEGLLSALQLEAVTYASQAHESHLLDTEDSSRAGFLIGDGAGVGKGRTIAGIIYENYLNGRMKSIWISVSNDLKYDAQRDFNDIGAPIVVRSLNKFQYNTRISSKINGQVNSGVLFCTYASLIGKSSSNAKFSTRMEQIVDWCGENFDGCIVFDECHKAKNLIPAQSLTPTQTGQAVVDLQFKLPNARVIYSSATGATEPRNMAYMVRLGNWGIGTPFRTFQDFQRTLERRGVGAMEVVAMDMKLRGVYVARQLSFQGVTFKIEKVPLTDDFIRMYNESVALWNLALRYFQQGTYLMNVEANTLKIIWSQYWGAHQRFFKYLAIAAKVDHTVKLTKEAVEAGKCVVIGLQSTGEARTNEEVEKCNGELDDYVSTAKAVFQSLVEKQFPALDRMDSNEKTEIAEASTSRKRQPVNKFKFEKAASRKRKVVNVKKSRFGRNHKRPRITSSSEDDSTVELFDGKETSATESSDSEDEYIPVKKECKSSRSANDEESSDSEDEYIPVKKEYKSSRSANDEEEQDGESESDPETESDLSEDEESESGDSSISSQDSSDVELNKKQRKRQRKSKTKLSKVQEHLRKRYQESNKASKSNKTTVKDDGLKNDIIESVRVLKDDLLAKIEELGGRLPKNTLDDLINKLGGSEKVAEMTGRKGRVAGTSDGNVQYESRREAGVSLEMLNIKEKERFMGGKKLIAIISEAASSGISLQSDRRVANQRRRLHMTLELPWAADRAIQQFGRTHRSNQVNAPEYIFLISELAGEQRFVATVARRLESLGALTHADRRATQSRDLSEFNIDNRFGRKALAATLRAIGKIDNPMVPPPEGYEGDFFADVHKALLDVDLNLNAVADEEKKSDNIVRFMNRSLGVPVHLQNHLFKYFSDTLHATIVKAKKENRFDPGLMDVGKPERITRISTIRFIRRHATGESPVELHTVRVDRGFTWSQALEKSQELVKAYEGFYIETKPKMGKQRAILIARLSDDDTQPRNLMMFGMYKPHTGYCGSRIESLETLQRSYHKTTSDKVEEAWIYQYNFSVDQCNHKFHDGRCTTSRFTDCDVGKRITTRVVLSGCVLGVWDRVEKQLRGGEDGEGQNIRMQVCRLRARQGQPSTIGILVPLDSVEVLAEELGADAVSVENVYFDELESQFIKIEAAESMKVEGIKLESELMKIEKTEQTEQPIVELSVKLLKCEPDTVLVKMEF